MKALIIFSFLPLLPVWFHLGWVFAGDLHWSTALRPLLLPSRSWRFTFKIVYSFPMNPVTEWYWQRKKTKNIPAWFKKQNKNNPVRVSRFLWNQPVFLPILVSAGCNSNWGDTPPPFSHSYSTNPSSFDLVWFFRVGNMTSTRWRMNIRSDENHFETRIRDAGDIVPLAHIMFETKVLYFIFVLFFWHKEVISHQRLCLLVVSIQQYIQRKWVHWTTLLKIKVPKPQKPNLKNTFLL